MARLPALIDDLARHDVRGLPTVELIARLVREAGFIQTTKRGRGAAEMTADDAAALLIGLCATDSPKAAPEAVRSFFTLSAIPGEAAILASDDPPIELAAVAAKGDFGGAVAELIRSADRIRELARRAADAQGRRMGRGPTGGAGWSTGFTFRVALHSPTPWAEILVEWEEDGERTRRFYRVYGFRRAAGMDDRFPPHLGDLDRSVEVALGFLTFLRLHQLLSLSVGS